MTLSVFTNFQGDTITGIRDADFAKEAFQMQSGADSFNCDDILLGHGAIGYEMQVGMGISANARGKTTGTIAALQLDTGSGDEHIIQYVTGDGSDNLQLETGLGEAGVECKVPPSLLKPQEGLDSRLINNDDFLLVNNIGGGPQGPGGTSYLTGYAEAVGLDSFTVDVVTCPPCGASLGGDFI